LVIGTDIRSDMFIHERAKVHLKSMGWSYRSAALAIGKSYQWVWYVLNGQQVSRPVCEAILRLPKREAGK